MIKVVEDRALAWGNLVGTYLRLAEATPGATILRDPLFVGSIGEGEHPICNFASSLQEPKAECARELGRLAGGRRTFNVYGADQDREALEDEGFACHSRLSHMIAEARSSDDLADVSIATSFDERARLSRFIVDQFFGTQSAAFRRQVASSTASASRLDLYGAFEEGELIGAFTLSYEGEAIGLYNLCVTPEARGKNLGSRMTQTALHLSKGLGRPVVLQCRPNLQTWYQKLGFRFAGSVGIYGLIKNSKVDIMGWD